MDALFPTRWVTFFSCASLQLSYQNRTGFIPQRLFLERLLRDRESICPFLVIGILSLSARFTPCLLRRYGGASNATNYFINRATSWVHEAMYKPSLENIQAFFTLAVAQWGNGDKEKSSVGRSIVLGVSERPLTLNRCTWVSASVVRLFLPIERAHRFQDCLLILVLQWPGCSGYTARRHITFQ